MFERAIALDPHYATAHAVLGENYFLGWIFLLNPDPNGLERALQLERQAIALDDSFSTAHALLADVYVQKGWFDQAVTEAQRAVALDPNSALAYYILAEVMNNMSRPLQALEAVEKRDLALTNSLWDHVYLVWDYSTLGEEDAARAEAAEVEQCSALNPNSPIGYYALAYTLSYIGEAAQALVAVQKAMYLDPQRRDQYLSEEGFN